MLRPVGDRCSYGCQGRLKRCWAACLVVPSTLAMAAQVVWCCRARDHGGLQLFVGVDEVEAGVSEQGDRVWFGVR
jgi:hypothetical protein